MSPFRFALREIRHRPAYAGLFLLSTALGTSGLTALSAFGRAVDKTVAAQARELWAADITVRGTEGLLDGVEPWARKRWPGLKTARTTDALSMARSDKKDRSGQITLSAVTENYPLYGAITAGDGRPLRDVLRPGSIVVGPKLLSSWGLALGDKLRIGEKILRIAGTVRNRTDVPTSFFELSPTVFITFDDLRASRLLAPGSRSSNVLYLNLPPGENLGSAIAAVKGRAAGESAEVESWSTDNPGILKFIRNVLLYTDFLGLLTLTLGGIGVATALSAAVAAGRRSMAMALALGAPRLYLARLWASWISLLTLGGVLLALVLGKFLAAVLGAAFGPLLPAVFQLGFPWTVFLSSTLVGAAASGLFAALPLLRAVELPPNAILTDDDRPAPLSKKRALAAAGLCAAAFFGLVMAHVKKPFLGLEYLGGLGLILAATWGLAALGMGALRRLLVRSRSLTPRLAARGLARPGNLNNAVVISVAMSLAAILTLFLLERNITTQMIESFPEGAPNTFFINIQNRQSADFKRIIGRPGARLFPLIRGRLLSVNDIAVQDINARTRGRREGDRLTREFGFTYGEDLLPTDKVTAGPGLWDPGIDGPQVSVFDDYRKRFGLRLGDRIAVNVLGRRFTATIASFRSINQSVRQPFFYFYFKPGLLDGVPHTYMSGVRLESSKIPSIENALAKTLPNVTSIDLSEVAALTGRIFHRLSKAVNVLGIFGLAAGALLLVSNILASLLSRTREGALFRVLGATRGQAARIALMEYALIGGAGALGAWIVGAASAAVILKRGFDLRLRLFPIPSALLLGGAVAVMVALSWLASRRIFSSPLLEVLRHE